MRSTKANQRIQLSHWNREFQISFVFHLTRNQQVVILKKGIATSKAMPKTNQ
jgi:hypothetical protein